MKAVIISFADSATIFLWLWVAGHTIPCHNFQLAWLSYNIVADETLPAHM